ncbi:hypothetical protein GF337_01680 [candidate division KSB1 bacterium]|nr:hypothetical protein [candidate division KSB1 bacterium]
MKRIFIIIIVAIILIQVYGCGVILKLKRDDGEFFPSGIDSLTAVESDSITSRLFVSEARKRKAFELFSEAQQNYELADSLWDFISTKQQDTADSIFLQIRNEKRNIISQKLERAAHELRKAARIDPFNLTIKDLLAKVYTLQGDFTEESAYYEKAIIELKEIISRDKSEHVLYYRLGENYYKLNEWQKAYQNYRQAEHVLLQTAFLNEKKEKKLLAGNYVVVDSIDAEIHFRYVYYQAITVAKLYNTELALSLFQKAQQIAPSKNQLKFVDNYTKWIRWDGGNIAASEKKNQCLQLIKEKKYKQAKIGFEDMIDDLNTQKARDEIGWRIACIEYEYLDQEKKGCDRLYKIIKNQPVNENNGLPVDPDYKRYFTDCGKMFYKLGLNLKKKSKYKSAYRCFENASQIQWFGRWESLLELAKLTVQDPDKTLEIINLILSSPHNLDKTEHLDALTLKLKALKRFGTNRLDDVKNTYKQIRTLQQR